MSNTEDIAEGSLEENQIIDVGNDDPTSADATAEGSISDPDPQIIRYYNTF